MYVLKYPTCRQTKFFFDKIDSNKSKKIVKLARSQLSRLSGVITGHNNLRYVQDNFIDYLCRLCEEKPETFTHIFARNAQD